MVDLEKASTQGSKVLFDNKIGETSKEEQEEWLTSREACEYLKLPLGTLNNWVSQGRIPYFKLGRLNRFKKSDLMRILLAQRRGGFYGN